MASAGHEPVVGPDRKEAEAWVMTFLPMENLKGPLCRVRRRRRPLRPEVSGQGRSDFHARALTETSWPSSSSAYPYPAGRLDLAPGRQARGSIEAERAARRSLQRPHRKRSPRRRPERVSRRPTLAHARTTRRRNRWSSSPRSPIAARRHHHAAAGCKPSGASAPRGSSPSSRSDWRTRGLASIRPK